MSITSTPLRCPKCKILAKYGRKNIETFSVDKERLRCKNCEHIFTKKESEKILSTYMSKKFISELSF